MKTWINIIAVLSILLSTLVGQRIAMWVQSRQYRVVDGAYYPLNDHLGGTTVTLDESANRYAELRYKAWGQTRYTYGTTPTQRRYTGQLEAEAGLYFYNARWYDPTLAHWIQPDSIVSNKYYPLDLDRYSYVRNNPVNYIDPSGHRPCLEDSYCHDGTYSETNHLKYLIRHYGIKFSGTWATTNQWAVLAGVQVVASKFASALGFIAQSALVFRDVYGIRGNKYFEFTWGCDECTSMGFTAGTRHIKFTKMYQTTREALLKNTILVVHELFHAFENAMETTLEDGRKFKEARSSLPSDFSREGLAVPFEHWQQSSDNTPGELFADMGIGWIYDKWNTKSDQYKYINQWMPNHMPEYIQKAIYNQR